MYERLIGLVDECQAGVGHICMGEAVEGLRALKHALVEMVEAAATPSDHLAVAAVVAGVLADLRARGYDVPYVSHGALVSMLLLDGRPVADRAELLSSFFSAIDHSVAHRTLGIGDYSAVVTSSPKPQRSSAVSPGAEAPTGALAHAGIQRKDELDPTTRQSLLRRMTDGAVTPPTFVAYARLLRSAMQGDTAEHVSEALAVIQQAAETIKRPTHVVEAAAHRLTAAVAARRPFYSEHQAARDLYVSTSVLAHRFRTETGVSFNTWRNALLVQSALYLLTTSDEQVAQIAYTLGLHHPPQLNRSFAHILWATPTSVRRWFCTQR